MSQLDVSQQQSVIELARNGNFRALAYWLNSQLVPQGIYVQVQAARPGCLQTVVEFHRQPIRDRLVRYICHRLWQLESDLIEGVQILARYIGQSDFLWQQTVRIPTRAERQQRQQGPQTVDVKARSAHIPPKINSSSSPKWLTLTFSSPQQLKLVRSFMLSGSAIAAFMMGFWLESITSRPSPTLPVISKTNPTSRVVSNRPSTVQAALETVAVMKHDDVKNPYDPSVTLMFGGEVSPADFNIGAAGAADAGLLAKLDATQSADLSMVSLSEPLANAATSLQEELYDLTRSESAEAFKQSGIDIVNLADDQIVDYGEAGLLETINSLDRAGVYRMGAGRDMHEARRPEIIDVKGQRIAYLGYSGADWLAAEGSSAGINPQEQTTVAEDIKAIRDQVDWIVVSYRWSEELSEATVADWQKNMARFAIDQGADLVVGQHPDVLQGAEVYKGRPIAYSLGDLVLEDDPYAEFDTAVLKVSLRPDQMRVEFVPVTVKDGHPQLAKGRHGKAILDRIHQSSESFEQPLEIPMVLDLRQAEPELEQPASPDAPFVDPDAPEMEILNPDGLEQDATESTEDAMESTEKEELEDSGEDVIQDGAEQISPLKEDKLDAAPVDEFAPADESSDAAPAPGLQYFGEPNPDLDEQPAVPDGEASELDAELDKAKPKNSELESPAPDHSEPNDSELENVKPKELDGSGARNFPARLNPFNPFNSVDRNSTDDETVPEETDIDSSSSETEEDQVNSETSTPEALEPDTSNLSQPDVNVDTDVDAIAPQTAPAHPDELHSEESGSSVEIDIPTAEPTPGASAEAPVQIPGRANDAQDPTPSGAIAPVEEPLVGPLVNQPMESSTVAHSADVEAADVEAADVEAEDQPQQELANHHANQREAAIALDQLEVALNTEIAHLNPDGVQAEPKFKTSATELKPPKPAEPQLPNLPPQPAEPEVNPPAVGTSLTNQN